VARGRGLPGRADLRQRFERGRTVTKLEVIGKSRKTGTKISWKPDPQIFPETAHDPERIIHAWRNWPTSTQD